VVIDKNVPHWVAEAHVTACPERDPNRILGNFDGISLQAAARNFDIIPVEIPSNAVRERSSTASA
jgi:hypothetical protein